jgi:hypothetical protein
VEGAVAAGVGDRERPALDLVGGQLLVAGTLRDVGDAARDTEQVQAPACLSTGDQALAVGGSTAKPRLT